MTAAASVDVARVQSRTLGTLVVSQAVGAVGMTIGVATASLLARDISGSDSMAGLAQTFQVLGTAAAAYLLAGLMARRGRRAGLVTGYVLGAGGALLAVAAGVADSMLLLLAGAVLLGATTAANQGSRYAATDLAPEETRARALSMVVWATTIGAVAGPNLTGVGAAVAHRLDIPELTGGFALGAVALVVAAAWVWLRLRPDPLLLAQSEAGVVHETGRGRSWGRFVEAVRAEPALGAAIVGMAGAHAAMVAVMIMTPLHMEHGGAHLTVIGFVISIHVLGMFAFSPLVGAATDRFGRPAVLVAGGVVLLVSLLLCALAPEGSSWQIFAGLFLLGLGWSFATVAASTVISDRTPITARTDVQGTADMAMALTAAGGGAVAGVIVDGFGYPVLAGFSALLALAVAGAGVVVARHAR
ncbi:MFS transporter [Nocardioides gansuensis]|uniref:MFS transporter n=1 Tax=Nocardioides gansuensis TaxID=2138300 RepID=A0A2T8F8K3_9ACTN|nr:MFS transporter [Nocardioides gansuensis]PVG82058.1 MFS transporter [Nocardioides gansuensis]